MALPFVMRHRSYLLIGTSLMALNLLFVDADADAANNPLPNPATLYQTAPSDQPLYPSRITTDSATALPVAPVASPVIAPSTAIKLPAPVTAGAPQPLPVQSNFVAPAPVITAQRTEALSTQTKTILSHIPSKIDSQKKTASQKLDLNRTNPDMKDALGEGAKVETSATNGMDIKVNHPGMDANYELNRAYTMLMGGQTQEAVNLYRSILASDANNQEALFALAATYQRLGSIEKARPLYGTLLRLNPDHREGLNNFLVLVSDESPQEALAELERLEQRNPDFSPIPAQSALLLDKLGFVVEARTKMLRAIELAPENLTYKYNLAVMLDRQGNYTDAAALYRLLIDASEKGAPIPSNNADLQKRLNYIAILSMPVNPPVSTVAAPPMMNGS
jgi:Flp pilus assembly protein TadD